LAHFGKPDCTPSSAVRAAALEQAEPRRDIAMGGAKFDSLGRTSPGAQAQARRNREQAR
jgi:hypothetical protein